MAKEPKMIHCRACGKEMAENAKVCPECGAPNKKPFYKKWWFWLVVALIVLGGAGSSANSGKPAASGAVTSGTTGSKALELQGEVSVENEVGLMYFTGVVVNNKGRDLSYASITFNLYDEDGNLLGTAIDNVNNLKADGTWKFKAIALCDSDEVASWELDSIEGF